MNVKKLPKEKRNKVILVWLITLTVASAWAFVVLKEQLDASHRAGENLDRRQTEFARMTTKLKQADEIQIAKDAAAGKLSALEEQMANSSDTFSWVVTTVREFKQAYPQVELPQFSQVTTGPATLLPKFPYQQASVTVAGTAYFHDLGIFVADFENQFHFARIINLDVAPSAGVNTGDREKLNFKMVIIFLVKPTQS